jgi:parallel beta-helix repeat protein
MDRAIGLFLLSTVLAGLVLVSGDSVASAQVPTQVNGVLTQNTIWSRQGSPYVFVGAVGVPVGVTLTVEAGVVVELGSYYLEVNGTLNVKGTASDRAVLRADANPAYGPVIGWAAAVPVLSDYGFSNIVAAYGNPTVNLEYTVLSNTSIFGQGIYSEAAVTIDGCTLLNSAINVWGSTSISNSYSNGVVASRGNVSLCGNTFLNGVEASGNFSVVGNSLANNGGAAVKVWGVGVISGNVIADSAYGVTQEDQTVLSVTIERNLIRNNTYGVYLKSESDEAVIKDNTFAGNNIGIFGPTYKTTIMGNNFVDNMQYDVQAGVDAASAAGNWWGTTNGTLIGMKIFDVNDDFSLGTIIYTPFLNSANVYAPQTTKELISPAVSASPTGDVVFQAVNSQGSSLGGFEVGVASAVVIAAVLVALLAVQAHRKRA